MQTNEQGARIAVVGVGGGGGNAVETMIRRGLQGVTFVAANTDRQALVQHSATTTVALGGDSTRGLGAGANPDVGRRAALDSTDLISEAVAGADLVFVTAGMGGGTGTGAAPVVARIAKAAGALTVGVVTRPFGFEGRRRGTQAEAGLEALLAEVDSLIVVSNDKLLATSGPEVTLLEAFDRADAVLLEAVRGITGLVRQVGIVNVDFADLKAVLTHRGLALMGAGAARGEGRALEAARLAAESPLLDGTTLDGALALLVNFTAGPTLTLRELNAAMSALTQRAHPDANIIFGSEIDPAMGDELRVTLVATGFTEARTRRERLVEEPLLPRRAIFRAPAQMPAAARQSRLTGDFPPATPGPRKWRND